MNALRSEITLRIALVNPTAASLSWFFYSQGMATPPVGMIQAATVLAEAGHEVRVFDGQATYEEQAVTLQRVIAFGPDVVGIGTAPLVHLYSFMSTTATPYWIDFARRLRGVGFDGPIALGGTYASRFPQRVLDATPEVQAIVVGEADASLAAFVEGIARGGDRTARVVLRPEQPVGLGVRRAAAACAPDYSLLEGWPHDYGIADTLFLGPGPHRTRAVLPLLTARGCPFRCTFCPTPVFFGGSYTAAPLEAALDHLEARASSDGLTAFSLWDDTFTVSPRRVEAFCDGLIARGLDLSWWCFGRSEWVCDNEALIPKMVRAGMRMMWLGVESSDDGTLDEYGRSRTHGTAPRAVDILVREGALPTTSFIIGHPQVTADSMAREYERSLAISGRGSINVYTLMIPLPGTPMHASLERSGRLLSDDLRLYGGTRAVIRYPHVDPQRVEEHFYRAYHDSILGPRFLERPGRANLSADGLDPASPARLEAGFEAEVDRMLKLERQTRPSMSPPSGGRIP